MVIVGETEVDKRKVFSMSDKEQEECSRTVDGGVEMSLSIPLKDALSRLVVCKW